ncbi:MAG: hypothetical protein AAB521_04015 [Patescibacteria group bacterium]
MDNQNQTPQPQTPPANQNPAPIPPPQPVSPSPAPNQPSSPPPFLSSKLLFVIAFVVILIAIGSGIFAMLNSNFTKPAPSPTPAPTSTPTPVDETATWKTYENTEYSISFKYPSEYTINLEKRASVFLGLYSEDVDELEFKFSKGDDISGFSIFVAKNDNMTISKYYDRQTGRSGASIVVTQVKPDGNASEAATLTDLEYYKVERYKNYFYWIVLSQYGLSIREHIDQILSTFKFTDQNTTPVACTEEAKICPDGSYVSRQGPNCEFAPCPSQ